jgi:hypothetical protein
MPVSWKLRRKSKTGGIERPIHFYPANLLDEKQFSLKDSMPLDEPVPGLLF